VMDGVSAEAVRDLILEAYSASLAQTA
jgi:hypothetical protein